jgi:glycine C-acetyltransferase
MLMVDEAHSFGVLGERGHGIQEHFGLPADAVDVKMATLSKSLPSSGGVVAGRKEIVDYLRHNARGYVFTGALPAVSVAAAYAGLEVLEREPERVARLWHNVRRYQSGLADRGFDLARSCTPITPILCPDELRAMEMTRLARADGVFVVPVVYPAVPMNAPRLRTCVLASHTDDDIDLAVEVLTRAGRRTGLIG